MAKDAKQRNRTLVNKVKSKRVIGKHGKVISFRPPPDLIPLVEDALEEISQADLLTEWGRTYYGMNKAQEQPATSPQ